MRKIEHLLPKDNRKNAKKKKIEELVDDLLLHVYHTLGGEEESEFDWKKFIKDSPEIEGLIEKNTDLIEAGMKRKQSKK